MSEIKSGEEKKTYKRYWTPRFERLNASLEELHRRIPDFEVRPEGAIRMHSSNVRGFAVLPIEFPS